MKSSVIFLFFILCVSCQRNEIHKSRFNFSKISQTSFGWYDNDKVSSQFRINYYISCDSDGNCLIARRDSTDSPLSYYKNTLPLTFDSLLNSIDLANLDSTYEDERMDKDPLIVHCGFPYCFIYEDKNHLIKVSKIMPFSIDSRIIKLVKSLETIALDSKQISKETIALDSLSNYLQTSFLDEKGFPKMDSAIKFTGPELK